MDSTDPTYTLPAPPRLSRGRLVAQALLMTLPVLSFTLLTAAAPFAGRADACAIVAAQDGGGAMSSGIQSSSP
jgi:hypothetical protein